MGARLTKKGLKSMNDEKTLVDTNVLVYALQPDSDRQAKAVAFIKDLVTRESGVVGAQNLAEFCSLATEKFAKTMDFEQASSFLSEVSKSLEVISYDENTVAQALKLSYLHDLHFFDALLAAAMSERGIETIATENEKDFKKIPWLKVVNPFKPVR